MSYNRLKFRGLKPVGLFLSVAMGVLLIGVTAVCQEITTAQAAQDAGAQWKTIVDQMNRNWEKTTSDIDADWNRYEKEQQLAWQAFKQAVEAKWTHAVYSTKKTWVDYNYNKDSRSRVDFEKGTVEIEVVLPSDGQSLKLQAREKIKEQTQKILSEEKSSGVNMFNNQLKDRKGRTVTDDTIEQFIQNEVLPKIETDDVPQRARDGVQRKKFTVRIDLVPDHLRVRAQKYLPIIKQNADRYQVDPKLILAIIHTESYFNPMAVSSCDAIGLMQVIPRWAGREAYQYIHGQDKLLRPSYLHDPANNIELGVTYLHLLKTRYFSHTPKNPKNRYLTICGYNWGPTAMKKKIVARYNVNAMSDSNLYRILRNKTPEETRNYLKRVTERMPIYAPFFN